MADEHDSWLKDAFGVDPGEVLKGIEAGASAAVKVVEDLGNQVVQGVQRVVTTVAEEVSGAVKKIPLMSPPGKPAAPAGAVPTGGTGSFPLSGSVGRGGKNSPNDVRAVQRALGVSVDGKCGPQTIGAITAFQEKMGQSKPDGRVDAGGATERALAGGGRAPASSATAKDGEDGSGSVFDRAVAGAKDLAGGLGDLGGRLLQDARDALGDPDQARDSLNFGGSGGNRLSLDHLSDDQVRTANDFLRAHGFVATWVRGAGTGFDDYQPVLDGKPTSLGEVTKALRAEIRPRPLQNPAAELKDLADRRYGELVSQSIKAADERNRRIVQDGAKVDADVSREDARKDLTGFLQKVLAKQGGKDLRVTEPVRLSGEALGKGLSGSDVAIATYLKGKSLPGSPAALADGITKLLPPMIPRSNVEALDRIPVQEGASTQPQSLSAALGAVLLRDLERVIRNLPRSWQETARKAVLDAVTAGIVAIADRAMKDSPLDEKAKKEIGSIVEAAIKQKANEPSMDRKQDTDGSPDAHEQPPSVAPPSPDSPEGEQLFKTPDIDLPDGTPPKSGSGSG